MSQANVPTRSFCGEKKKLLSQSADQLYSATTILSHLREDSASRGSLGSGLFVTGFATAVLPRLRSSLAGSLGSVASPTVGCCLPVGKPACPLGPLVGTPNSDHQSKSITENDKAYLP